MPMNMIIQEKRKELGLTQEQVADYLGVSTPAVSKWEKGITSPDVGLLPSLARLLKIDLNTLFCFHEDLSPQEIGMFCNELAMLARDNIVSAFELAEAKLHEFPHNEQLRLNVTIILDSSLLQSHSTDVPKEELDTKVSSWYNCLGQSADEKIRNSANYMRASRYIRQNKLDAAQEVLDTIQDKSEIISILPDKLMLQVSIYLQQGNAEKSKEMVDLFDLWEYNKYTTSYQIASQEEDADTILSLLEQMLEALMSPWKLNESVLYHRMAPETKEIQSKEILAIILKELETDPDCEYLREHPKGKELIEKYKAK